MAGRSFLVLNFPPDRILIIALEEESKPHRTEPPEPAPEGWRNLPNQTGDAMAGGVSAQFKESG